MSDPTAADMAARLDDLLKEVRRQGRAAIAAQAAAESCLEAIRAEAARREDEGVEEPDDEEEPDDDGEAVRWLRALIPVADAVDRVVKQVASLDAPRERAKPSLLQRLVRAPEPGDDHARAALAEGLRVLHAQLEGALRDLGVDIDRRTGSPVDGDTQRVVEVRAPRAGERPGTVVEVVRPGYALEGTVVREAEVVVAEGR